MANPGPVAAALWTDEEVEAGVQLDSIITGERSGFLGFRVVKNVLNL
jgi:hypothetical protein